jgi:predicted RNase H-like nuclease (RuvC/YqgF family)
MIITNVTNIPNNELSDNMLKSLIEFRKRQGEQLPALNSSTNPYINVNNNKTVKTVALTNLNTYKKRICNTNQLINKMKANKNNHSSKIQNMQRKHFNIRNRIKRDQNAEKMLYTKYQHTLPNYLRFPYKNINNNNIVNINNDIYKQYENLYNEYKTSSNFTPDKLMKCRIGVQSLIKRNENELKNLERKIRASLQVKTNLNKQINHLENTKKTYTRIAKELKNKQNSKNNLEKRISSNIKKRVLNNLSNAVKKSAKKRKLKHETVDMIERRKKDRFDELWTMFGQKK